MVAVGRIYEWPFVKLGVVEWYVVYLKNIQCVYSLKVDGMTPSQASNLTQSNSYKNNLRAIKNVAIVMGLFIVTWMPYVLLNFVETFDPLYYANHGPIQTLQLFLFGLFLVNSAVNPIIYGVRYRGFNVALRLMFGCISEDGCHTTLESVISA